MSSIDFNLFQNREERLMVFQLDHSNRLRDAGVLARMSIAVSQQNSALVDGGCPIVLGSTNGDELYLFLAFRTVAQSGRLASKYFNAGKKVGTHISANTQLGLSNDDVALVNDLFNEAQDFKTHFEPEYSLETGLLNPQW